MYYTNKFRVKYFFFRKDRLFLIKITQNVMKTDIQNRYKILSKYRISLICEYINKKSQSKNNDVLGIM